MSANIYFFLINNVKSIEIVDNSGFVVFLVYMADCLRGKLMYVLEICAPKSCMVEGYHDFELSFESFHLIENIPASSHVNQMIIIIYGNIILHRHQRFAASSPQ